MQYVCTSKRIVIVLFSIIYLFLKIIRYYQRFQRMQICIIVTNKIFVKNELILLIDLASCTVIRFIEHLYESERFQMYVYRVCRKH